MTLPFIKWAGGKRKLLPIIKEYIPKNYNTYFEPFIGGGALFFNLQPENAVISESNKRLIRTYKAIKSNVFDVIDLLKTYPYDPDFFKQIRQLDIDNYSDVEVAAWFIYLNKSCFNGLYRVNKQNQFNAPFGRYLNPTICDENTLLECSKTLQTTSILAADFRDSLKMCKPGDFVYLDPPYVPLSITSSFTSYTSEGFGLKEHTELRDSLIGFKNAGVSFLLSNSSSPIVKDLYKGFEIIEVLAARSINRNSSCRGKIAEYLIR